MTPVLHWPSVFIPRPQFRCFFFFYYSGWFLLQFVCVCVCVPRPVRKKRRRCVYVCVPSGPWLPLPPSSSSSSSSSSFFLTFSQLQNRVQSSLAWLWRGWEEGRRRAPDQVEKKDHCTTTIMFLLFSLSLSLSLSLFRFIVLYYIFILRRFGYQANKGLGKWYVGFAARENGRRKVVRAGERWVRVCPHYFISFQN